MFSDELFVIAVKKTYVAGQNGQYFYEWALLKLLLGKRSSSDRTLLPYSWQPTIKSLEIKNDFELLT